MCSRGYFYSSTTGSCSECSGGLSGMGILAVLIAAAVVVAVVVHLRSQFRRGASGALSLDDLLNVVLVKLGFMRGDMSDSRRKDIAAARAEAKRRAVVKLRIYVTLYQIISAMAYVLDFRFPSAFRAITATFNILNTSVSNDTGLSCTSPFDYVDVLLATTLIPIAVTAALWLGYRVQRGGFPFGVSGVSGDALLVLQSSYTYLFLFFTYLIFPGVSTVIFRMFSCQNIDPDGADSGDNLFLRADYSISCHSDRYYFGLVWAVVMLLVYPIGIPAMYYCLLKGAQQEIVSRLSAVQGDEARRRQLALSSLAFLFEPYKPRYWYWELVETMQRLLLSGESYQHELSAYVYLFSPHLRVFI